MNKLLKTIKKLRDPLNGCNWDKKQTHKSLMPYVIEEAYEVIEAIDEKSTEKTSYNFFISYFLLIIYFL